MFLLVGYGNPLRTDDGVGQVVAEQMAGTVESIACHQLLPEHAELISHADRVIFIDAAAGEPPGEILVREITAVPNHSTGLIHDFTPQTLLAYAELLYGRSPQACLVTVNGYSFDHGEELSEEMTAVLPDLLSRVKSLITENRKHKK